MLIFGRLLYVVGIRVMKCPYCGYQDDKVLESRTSRDGEVIKRRRECLDCGRRYTTYEQVEETRLMVIKKDGSRVAFDRDKILKGMLVACHKRPVSIEELESIADEIEKFVYDSGRREIETEELGELVMEALRRVDQVAYVRFASVYRQFEDVGQFKEIVNILGRRTRSESKKAQC